MTDHSDDKLRPPDGQPVLRWPDDGLDAALHRQLSAQQHERGDELAALAHLIAAKAVEAWQTDHSRQAAWDLYLVATGYFMKEDYPVAEHWYQLVLRLDPRIAEVYQNLVVIHLAAGRTVQAEQCRAHAYALQRVFIDPILQPVRRLLILCAGRTSGNVPIELLLSADRSMRIKYMIDYATAEEDRNLPEYDLVFNAVGEPDVATGLQARMAQFLHHCTKPVLNQPAQVLRTRRDTLPDLLAGLPDVRTAACQRVTAALATRPDQVSDLVPGYPALVRPAGTHGGAGMVRCTSPEELTSALAGLQGEGYLSELVNVQSPDGFYRKYRVVFVGGHAFPYHLAISPHWIAHYYTAEMLQYDWKIAEERAFLQDPASVLGERGMHALQAIAGRVGLDYFGVDFACLPDGELFVFEANATMLVHRVSNSGPVAYKNPLIMRIADAFEALQAQFEKTV